MNSNEFIYWLRGIVDSTTFMPTKKTWDIIVEVMNTVKLSKTDPSPLNDAVIHRMNELNRTPNELGAKSDSNHKKNNNP
jgi:hypothetical protein